MHKSERLKPVVKLANHKEKESARALAKAREQLQAAIKKMQDLNDYRDSYAQMLHSKGKTSISANELRRYQIFLSQLDEAIKQQEVSILEAENVVNSNIAGWKEKKMRHQIIGKVTNKIQKEELISEEKRQQKQIDDQTSLRFFNARNK